MLVPKLRFKRDDGTSYPEWNKDKWSDLGDFIASGTLSKSNLSDTGTPCILYGELYTKYREVAHTIYSKTNSVSHIFSKADDVILPKSGETPEDISTATCVPYDNISLGGDLIIFRHNEKVIGTYLSYLISNRAKNAIASIAQGKSVVHISEKSLSNIELSYPHPEEQQKIADFLSTVDDVIAQSEAEVRNLEQQKKAVMQKIFSQEIRFKREDGTEFSEWEERELSYCFESRDTKQIPTDEAPLMAFIAYKGVADKGDRYDRSYLVKTDNKKYKRTEYNDFIYSSNNLDVGSIGLNKYGTAVISVVYEIFKVKETAIPDFVNVLVQTPENMYKIIQYRQGCLYGQYKIFADDFLSVKTAIPCLEEQQKIADFLSAYDEAITYAKQELDKWKEMKKGLLQQMFV